MLAIKNLVIGVKTFERLSWTQSDDDGLKPIVIIISKVMKEKQKNQLKYLVLLLSKYSDKISVQRNVDAKSIVPSATGSGE